VSAKPTPVEGPAISPTPRARKDDRVRYNDAMREKAAVAYRTMRDTGRLEIAADVPEVVGWLRRHGVRVCAHMDAEGTFYSLVDTGVAGA
jgi:hypothetical protein